VAGAELVETAFAAFAAGDADRLRELLHPEVQWFGPDSHAFGCQSRDEVLGMLLRRPPGEAVVSVDRVTDGAELVLVEFTAVDPERGDEACMVLTVRDGRVVRMQGHRTRAAGLADAGLAPEPVAPPPVPREDVEPGDDRVTGLIPFTRVADVERSIAFYERLGFEVTDRFPADAPRLGWAALESGEARVMFERTDRPPDPRAQGVLFYLYARDLFGLRERLVRDGVAAGEIVDGSPGPRAEMEVVDPDGYVLMIAQTD
jgi:ketosteroid isomerase-like protein/catechol 2,3-dioxygenase-like lactoylglutathione lyase family enzyme